MGTVSDKLKLLLDTKNAIRNAIISKGQPVAGTDPFASYPAKIEAIQTGADTSDATAAAGDILSGKTAYVKGKKVTGTIASRSASSLSASGAAVTVPAGYYPSQVSKSVASATQATPSISVSSAGLVTASATQSAGYVAAGTKSATKQLTVQAAQTITPGTSAKTAVASGRYTTGAVTVAGDANLLAENIKKGISIFGVDGTYAGEWSATDDVSILNNRVIAENIPRSNKILDFILVAQNPTTGYKAIVSTLLNLGGPLHTSVLQNGDSVNYIQGGTSSNYSVGTVNIGFNIYTKQFIINNDNYTPPALGSATEFYMVYRLQQ